MLNVIYSSSMANNGTLSYLAGIKSKIEVKTIDIDTKSVADIAFLLRNMKNEQILALRPLKDYQEDILDMYLELNNKADVEGIMQYKELTTTITADRKSVV